MLAVRYNTFAITTYMYDCCSALVDGWLLGTMMITVLRPLLCTW